VLLEIYFTTFQHSGQRRQNEFFMHSRKLPDLSNEAAMLDTCCTMCSGLSRLLEDGSNLLDVVTALVHTHPSNKKYRPEIGA